MANPFPPGSKENLEWAMTHPEAAPAYAPPAPAPAPQPATMELAPTVVVSDVPPAVKAQMDQQQQSALSSLIIPKEDANKNYRDIGAVPSGYVRSDGLILPAGMVDPSKLQGVDPMKLNTATGPEAGGTQGNEPLPPPGNIRATPGVFVKGGWVPHSRATSEEQGLRVGPETLALRDQAQDLQRQALDTSGEAERERIRITSEHRGKSNAADEIDQMASWQRKEERDRMVSEAKAKYDRLAEAANDPEHFWADKSNFERVLANLGIAMGTFAAILTKTPNFALQRLNDAIDRDTRAQLRNLDKADKDIQDLYGQFDSEDKQLAAGRAARREMAIAQLDQALTTVNDEAKRAQILEARGKLADDQYRDQLTLTEKTQGKKVVQGTEQHTPDRYVGGSPGGKDWRATIAAYVGRKGDMKVLEDAVTALRKITPNMSRDDALAAILGGYQKSGIPTGPAGKEGAEGQESTKNFVPFVYGGRGGQASQPALAADLTKMAIANNRLRNKLTEMKAIRSKFGSSLGSLAARYRTLAQGAIVDFSIANGQGTVTAADYENYGPLVGLDANGTFTLTGEAQLDAAMEVANGQLRSIEQATEPVERTAQNGTVASRITAVPRRVDKRAVPTRKAGEK